MWDPAAEGETAAEISDRLGAAAETCRRACPALPQCEAWFDGLDPNDPTAPSGVVAGRLISTGRRGLAPVWARESMAG
jgi:hypothetical protein